MRRFNIFAARVGAHGVLGRHHGTPVLEWGEALSFFPVSSSGRFERPPFRLSSSFVPSLAGTTRLDNERRAPIHSIFITIVPPSQILKRGRLIHLAERPEYRDGGVSSKGKRKLR